MSGIYQTPPDYPIADGFWFWLRLKCDLRFRSMVLQNYDAMRRSGGLRSRAWTVPNDSNAVVIPARDSYEFQVYAEPGSVIWSYTFVAPAGQFSFEVTETCTDVPLLSEAIYATGVNALGFYPQQHLTKPLVIPQSGNLNVQIHNLTGADATRIQLILWGGEPVNTKTVCS